ncbi:AAA family ATPase [Nanoarchaeota archaeon]
MIINSVHLKNIRSYEDEVIEFSDGNILLSGDIGCGKSSILLAIEFALFGIMRGGLSGTALLRHGKNEGSVILKMEIEGKKVAIFRALKRSKDTVNQAAGYIVVDGEKFEGTPVELKARILEMIGYPEELVSKSKSLIYRYTVYTPQEEMKAILLEGDEIRLDTLRKIFNIDKYKRIKENSALLARELRSKRKVLESKLEDHEGLKQNLKEKEERKAGLGVNLTKAKSELDNASKLSRKVKEQISIAEKDVEERREKEQKLKLAESSIEGKETSLEDNKQELESLSGEIKQAEAELKGKSIDIEAIKEKIAKAEAAIAKAEEKLSEVKQKEAAIAAKKENAEDIKGQIADLDQCPVCLQEVPKTHVAGVTSGQDEIITESDKKLAKAAEFQEQVQERLAEFKEKLSELREKESQATSLKEKAKSLDEKKQRKSGLEKKSIEIQGEIKGLKQKSHELSQELKKTQGLAEKLDKAKEDYEDAREKENEVKVRLAEAKKELESLDETITDLKARLAAMESARKNLRKLKEAINWIEDYFTNVIDVMERQVMLRIYTEFNEYFVEWFNVLMEDETLSVRLDDSFAPMVIQDGYETSVENLSGGEKTSIALAYRLSLNKVINDFISTIKTKNLIILDEPTDGFSSEQLDRVREVLRQLNIDQIILVSHEPKMESYVDKVIRISKQDNTSKVF